MAVFQCKMCGGALDINEGQNIAICPYCGSKQTIPKLDNDKVNKILERANTLRLNGEYDKAIDEYQKIFDVNDVVDAEIYWNVVLCKYGVVYVDDANTGKKVPTVNRTQMTSVLLDEDYQKTIELADPTTRQMYEEEARKIDDIQQGILAISRNEDPFDIFICYKETDDQGNRTRDSVNANEIYHYLTDEGYKVFFSRITLEDKVGKYEPYIFAALNSAKIMIVIGSKKEFFEAPWVKNEWMRYINIMKKEQGRTQRNLIPCYRDMDPYDLPKEFSYYQAQDMNKLGFIPDLVRGIKKIIPKNNMQQQNAEGYANQGMGGGATGGGNQSVNSVIKKAKIFIEQRDYENAKRNLSVAFDIDPENWEIYLCNLLMDYNLGNENELKNLSNTFDNNYNYRKILEFADEPIANRIKSYNDYIIERLAEQNAGLLYNNANDLAQFKTDNAKLADARNLYLKIKNHKDSEERAKKCTELIYSNIVNDFDNSQDVNKLEKAKNDLSYIVSQMDTQKLEEDISKKIVYCKALGVKNSAFANIQAVDESIRSLNDIRDFQGVSDLIYELETKKISIDRNVKKAKRVTFLTAFAAVFVLLVLLMVSFLTGTLLTNGFVKVKVTDQNDKNYGRTIYVYKINGKIQEYGNVGGIPIFGGIVARDAWFKSGEKYYYYDSNGEQVKGKITTIDGKQYAFNNDGSLVVNDFYNGQFFDAKGQRITNGLAEIDGKVYYLDKEGKKAKDDRYPCNNEFALIGVQKIDEVEYNFGEDGIKLKNAWDNSFGSYAYYDENGARVKGKNGKPEVIIVDGKHYGFDDNGNLITNNFVGTLWAKSDGSIAFDEVVRLTDGKKYYFDAEGKRAMTSAEAEGRYLLSGGVVADGNINDTYYVDGFPYNGEIGGKHYSNGKFAKNTWSGDFYLDGNGMPVYNQFVDNNRYYVGADGRYLRDTTMQQGNVYYTFASDGTYTKQTVTTYQAPEELGDGEGGGRGTEIATVDVSVVLSTPKNRTINGCKVTYVTVDNVVTTNSDRQDVANAIARVLDNAESEVMTFIENTANSSPRPEQLKLTKYVITNCTKKKATVKVYFSGKKKDGKTFNNKQGTISIDVDDEMYSFREPSIKLD